MPKKWTDEEVSKLKKYYSDHTNEYISNNILENRTVQSIGSKAQSLNLDNNLIGAKWSKSEEEILKEKYSSYTCKEISKKFLEERSVESIKRKANRMDLNSSPIQESESEVLVDCQLCGKEYCYETGSGKSKTYCPQCMIRRKRIVYKQAIVSISGDKCNVCGHSKCYSSLTFHHTEEKNFHMKGLDDYTYEQIADELHNVELLCENCHTKEHCEGSRGYCPEHDWSKRCCTKDDSCNQSCYVMHLRHERRLQFIEEKGGECEECGYSGCTGALSFHHRNPDEKEFRLDVTAFSRSMDSLEEEVAKCDLLCHNCHQKHHCECEVKCSDMFDDYAERAEEQIRSYL